MKQFNLEEYLKNPSCTLVTRDGYPVRIICTDALNIQQRPIIAQVRGEDGYEETVYYNKQGTVSNNKPSVNDLFFDTDPHEGWINIYKNDDAQRFFGGIYESKEEAENRKGHGFVTSVKIKVGE